MEIIIRTEPCTLTADLSETTRFPDFTAFRMHRTRYERNSVTLTKNYIVQLYIVLCTTKYSFPREGLYFIVETIYTDDKSKDNYSVTN